MSTGFIKAKIKYNIRYMLYLLWERHLCCSALNEGGRRDDPLWLPRTCHGATDLWMYLCHGAANTTSVSMSTSGTISSHQHPAPVIRDRGVSSWLSLVICGQISRVVIMGIMEARGDQEVTRMATCNHHIIPVQLVRMETMLKL